MACANLLVVDERPRQKLVTEPSGVLLTRQNIFLPRKNYHRNGIINGPKVNNLLFSIFIVQILIKAIKRKLRFIFLIFNEFFRPFDLPVVDHALQRGSRWIVTRPSKKSIMILYGGVCVGESPLGSVT